MKTGGSIIIAALILAVAFRWETVIDHGIPIMLDRWTGQVVACHASKTPGSFGFDCNP